METFTLRVLQRFNVASVSCRFAMQFFFLPWAYTTRIGYLKIDRTDFYRKVHHKGYLALIVGIYRRFDASDRSCLCSEYGHVLQVILVFLKASFSGRARVNRVNFFGSQHPTLSGVAIARRPSPNYVSGGLQLYLEVALSD